MQDNPEISLVIPIYNEEETLPELFLRLTELLERLDTSVEIILVNDGSRDKSYELMVEYHNRDPRFKVVHFARNFGHQVAITAGMDLAGGRAIITMDADLQDPPEVIEQMIEKWREGYEMVYAVRKKREGETLFKKVTANLFYRILRRMTQVDIPVDVGDFRLIDRKAMNAFNSMREKNRFIRGMFSWVGFKQTAVYYERAPRFAGETKYPLSKMIKLASDAVISFSNIPLQLSLIIGFLVSSLAFLSGVAAIVVKLAGVYTVRGWTSTVVVLSFLGGVQLMVLGMMGLYVARIHEEVKNRPLYIVSDLHGWSGSNSPSSISRAFIWHQDQPDPRR